MLSINAIIAYIIMMIMCAALQDHCPFPSTLKLLLKLHLLSYSSIFLLPPGVKYKFVLRSVAQYAILFYGRAGRIITPCILQEKNLCGLVVRDAGYRSKGPGIF
jgi:hypothetical protein